MFFFFVWESYIREVLVLEGSIITNVDEKMGSYIRGGLILEG